MLDARFNFLLKHHYFTIVPVGVGLALVVGTIGSYVDTPKGNAPLLFLGVVMPTVFYLIWGIMEIISIPIAK